jgi:hypothetical protein
MAKARAAAVRSAGYLGRQPVATIKVAAWAVRGPPSSGSCHLRQVWTNVSRLHRSKRQNLLVTPAETMYNCKTLPVGGTGSMSLNLIAGILNVTSVFLCFNEEHKVRKFSTMCTTVLIKNWLQFTTYQ